MFLIPKAVTSVHVGLPAQALFIQTGGPCMSSEAGPARCGWMEGVDRAGRACGHFLGGQNSLSLAHSSKMRKGPWWAGGTRTQAAALKEFAGNMSYTNPPVASAPRPLTPGKTESGLGKRRQICAIPRESPQPTGRKGKMSSSREQPPKSYPSAKALMSPWRLVGHLSSNQNWFYPDKC